MLDEADNIYELPYGRIGMLPPALFGNISEDEIVLTRDLTVPRSNKKITAMVDDYMDWAMDKAHSNKYTLSSFPNRDVLLKKLHEFKGMKYPIDHWNASARVVQDALKNEQLFIIDTHSSNRINNTAYDHDELEGGAKAAHRQHKSYVVATSKIVSGDYTTQATRDIIQLPVGEYGEEAAAKLARTTIFLNDVIKKEYVIDRGVRNRMTTEDEELLRDYTARSRERYEASIPDYAVHGVKNTLTEGILSISQTIAFLTAEKVPGYDDFDELVRDILDSDVIEQFTRVVEPGYIGPATLSGLYMHDALEKKNDKLSLSKKALDIFGEMRRKYLAKVAAQWVLHKESGGSTEKPLMLGLVCPAAKPKGALTMSKEAFMPFYDNNYIVPSPYPTEILDNVLARNGIISQLPKNSNYNK
jgi:hypothetical protein